MCVGLFNELFFFFYLFIVGEGEKELDRVVMAADRQAAIQRQKEEAKKRRRKKKRTGSSLFASWQMIPKKVQHKNKILRILCFGCKLKRNLF